VVVSTPDFKQTPPGQSSSHTPSKASPQKSEYHQLNIAVMAISSRLATFEDSVFSQLYKIENCIEVLSQSIKCNSITPSSSEDLHVWDFMQGPVSTHATPVVSSPVVGPSPVSFASPIISSPGIEQYTPLSSAPFTPDSSLPLQPQPSFSNSASTVGTQSAFSDPTPQVAQLLGLTMTAVNDIKQKACSRKNFAARICTVAFTEKERKESNCRGIKNRKQLDKVRLNLVRQLTYLMYPVPPGVSEETDWNKTCVKAIDEINRRKM